MLHAHPADMHWPADRFANESDPDVVLAAAAEALGRGIGVSRAFYGEIDYDADQIYIALDWTDGVPSAVGTYPFARTSGPVQQMLRDGVTVVEDVDSISMSDEFRAVNKASHTYAWIAMPLMQGDRPVALVAVTNLVPRTFSEADIEFVREVGNRTWHALVHARTLARLRESQSAMDARAQHEMFFRAVGDEIRDDRRDLSIIAKVATMLRGHMGVAGALIAEPLAGDPRTICVHHQLFGEREAGSELVRIPRATKPLLDRLGRGETVSCEDVSGLEGELSRFLMQRGFKSFVSAPVLEDGRLVAIFTLHHDTPRQWLSSDLRLVGDLADRVWAAIARVRAEIALAERERNQAFLIAWSDAVRDENEADRIIEATLSRLESRFEGMVASLTEIGAAGRTLEAQPDPQGMTREGGRLSADRLEAPVVSDGRLAAVLAIQADHPQRWPASDRQILQDLAGRLSATLERARAQSALAQSRTALGQAERMAALGSVLGGISHELNNPLAAVTAQAQLIALLAEGTELAARAATIHEASDRCARIVKNFAAMARQAPPERRQVDIDAVIRRAVLQVASARDVPIRIRAATDLPAVHGDPDQLFQIIVNLLVNAQQAVSNGWQGDRQVTIDARCNAPRNVHIDVADSGPGIPDDARSRVFEPFFTTKPAGEGTGMGLALAQGLAELHGGSLTLLPSVRGATFRLSLPAMP